MLCALIILVLASGAMVTEIMFASHTYKESLDVSQGQLLCSTLTNTVKQQLRAAENIKTGDDGKVTSFFCSDYGEGIFRADEGGQIYFGETPVLSSGAYPNGLRAQVELSYDANKNIFKAEITVSSPAGQTLASSEFSAAPMN